MRTTLAAGNIGCHLAAAASAAVIPMPSRWVSTTTSTSSTPKPASSIAAVIVALGDRAQRDPIAGRCPAAPHGSTTIVVPPDSTTHTACPTSTCSPSVQGSADTPAARRSAGSSDTAAGSSPMSKYGTRVRTTPPRSKIATSPTARHRRGPRQRGATGLTRFRRRTDDQDARRWGTTRGLAFTVESRRSGR